MPGQTNRLSGRTSNRPHIRLITVNELVHLFYTRQNLSYSIESSGTRYYIIELRLRNPLRTASGISMTCFTLKCDTRINRKADGRAYPEVLDLPAEMIINVKIER